METSEAGTHRGIRWQIGGARREATMRSGGQAATLIDACTRGAGRGSDGVSASPVSRFRLCSPALSSFSHRNLLATARLIKAKPTPPSYQPPSVHPTETPSQAMSSRRSMAEASLEPNSELLAGTGLEGHVRFGPAGFEDLMGTTLSLRHSLPAPPFCLRAVIGWPVRLQIRSRVRSCSFSHPQ